MKKRPKPGSQRKQFCARFPVPVVLTFLMTGLLSATPDGGITIVEKILGTNAEGYAIIRTVTDNPGSYYVEDVTVWLDEYLKKDGLAAKPKSTLLLDQKHTRDPGDGTFGKENNSPSNPKSTLADFLDQYQINSLTPWTPDQVKELDFDSETCRTRFRSQNLVDPDQGKGEKHFRLDPGAGWLTGVAEDHNALFLTVFQEGNRIRSTRIVCIPPKMTRNFRALKTLEPIYLSAGIFDSPEKALSRAMELTMDKAIRGKWEVWEDRHGEPQKTSYVVVLARSGNVMSQNRRGKGQQRMGVPLLPIPSGGFRKLITNDSP